MGRKMEERYFEGDCWGEGKEYGWRGGGLVVWYVIVLIL